MPFIRMAEAARRLGLHRVTICTLEREGRIPKITRNWCGTRMFQPEDLERIRAVVRGRGWHKRQREKGR